MSKDIIYREDAITLLWYFQDECCSAVVGDFEKLPSAETEIEIIRAEAYAKGIDSERKRISDWCRPKGEWEERPSEDWISIRRWYCSECGEWQTYGMTNYCPNCGCRMKGAEND